MMHISRNERVRALLCLAEHGIYKSDAITSLAQIENAAPEHITFDDWIETVWNISDDDAINYYGHDAARAVIALSGGPECVPALNPAARLSPTGDAVPTMQGLRTKRVGPATIAGMASSINASARSGHRS